MHGKLMHLVVFILINSSMLFKNIERR